MAPAQHGAHGSAASSEGGGDHPHGHGLAESLESFIRPLEKATERISDMIHTYTHAEHDHGGGSGAGESGGGSAASAEEGASHGTSGGGALAALASPRQLLGLSADAVTAGIQESVALLQQIKSSVSQLAGDVQDGSLQRLSRQLADSRRAPPRRRSYSMLLAQVGPSLSCLFRASPGCSLFCCSCLWLCPPGCLSPCWLGSSLGPAPGCLPRLTAC